MFSGRFNGWTRVIGVLALALAGSTLLGGCNQAEMNALKEENTQLRTDKESVTQQLAASEARRQEAEAQAQALIAAKNQQPMSPPADRPGNRPDRSNSNTQIDRITVAGDNLFQPGKAEVTAAGKKELDKVAAKIKKSYAGHHLRIEGYTDSDPITKSSWGSNEALSAARAASVEKYLKTKGLSDSMMEAVGMGSAKAKATKAASRRVEIVVLGK